MKQALPVQVKTEEGDYVGFSNLNDALKFLLPFKQSKEKRMEKSFGGKLPELLKERLVKRSEKLKLPQVEISRAGLAYVLADDKERIKMLAQSLHSSPEARKAAKELGITVKRQPSKKPERKLQGKVIKLRRKRALAHV